MDIFKEVRERADILQVCDALGIRLNRNYKAICPFDNHKEKTASFSIHPQKNIFCCFGCGKKGNSITLVQEMLKLSPLDSAKYINQALNLGVDVDKPTNYLEINRYKQKRETEERFKQWENQTLRLLCDYLHLLEDWKKEKAPKNFDDEIDNLYIEAINNEDYISYLIDDIFINGTNEDKIWFWKTGKRWVKEIETRFRTFRTIGK